MSLEQGFYIEPRESQKQHLSLNGEWKFGFTDTAVEDISSIEYKYKDMLPSAVYFNLYNAGVLPHPYKGVNSRQYRWVDSKVWYYEREFDLSGIDDLGQAFLCFESAAYYSKIWINGIAIGTHEGMYGGPICEIGSLLNYGAVNTVTVEIKACNYGYSAGEWEKLFHSEDKKQIVPWNLARDSYTSNGDFNTFGILGDIRIEFLSPFHLSRPYLTTESIQENGATLHLSCEIATDKIDELKVLQNDDKGIAEDSYVYGYFRGLNFEPTDIKLVIKTEIFEKTTGKKVYSSNDDFEIYDYDKLGIVKKYHECQFFEKDITLKDIKLWYPLGLGEQPLYTCVLSLVKDEKTIDELRFQTGLRKVEAFPTAGRRFRTRWGKYLFSVNGKKFFAKGINWMPLDFLFTCTGQDYRWAIELCKNAGIRMLRVWGAGGCPERDIFYKLCDEAGILVMQDTFLSNTDRQEWDAVLFRKQLTFYLYRIRNHPSLIMHCGGNENNPYSAQIGNLMWVVQREIEDIDPARLFIRSTPDKGGAHIYRDFEPTLYRKLYNELPFIVESGIHSFPNEKALRKVISDSEMQTPMSKFLSKDVLSHLPELINHFSQNDPEHPKNTVTRISQMVDMNNATVEDVCYASSVASYEFYQQLGQAAVENYPYMGGLLPWTFKRPWTTVGAQVMDGDCEPTGAYYALLNSYRPLEAHLILDWLTYSVGEQISLKACVINEKGLSYQCRLKLHVYSPNLKTVYSSDKDISLNGEYRQDFDFKAFCIPKSFLDSFFFINISLYVGEERVCGSVYTPKCIASMQDDVFKAELRSGKKEGLYFEKGPWLKPQIENCATAQLDIKVNNVYFDDFLHADITVKNISDNPAYPVRIISDEAGTVLMADDNFLLLKGGESRNIKATIRIKADNLSMVPLSVTAWNAQKKTININCSDFLK